jgi:hypothetical protein
VAGERHSNSNENLREGNSARPWSVKITDPQAASDATGHPFSPLKTERAGIACVGWRPALESALPRTIVRYYDLPIQWQENGWLNMPEFVYVMVENPLLIAIPIVTFAALALWSHSRTAWATTAAWVLYLGYEVGMHAAVLCRENECMKRSPLYVVYPLLGFLSLVALVQAYVRLRDKRKREESASRNPTATA